MRIQKIWVSGMDLGLKPKNHTQKPVSSGFQTQNPYPETHKNPYPNPKPNFF